MVYFAHEKLGSKTSQYSTKYCRPYVDRNSHRDGYFCNDSFGNYWVHGNDRRKQCIQSQFFGFLPHWPGKNGGDAKCTLPVSGIGRNLGWVYAQFFHWFYTLGLANDQCDWIGQSGRPLSPAVANCERPAQLRFQNRRSAHALGRRQTKKSHAQFYWREGVVVGRHFLKPEEKNRKTQTCFKQKSKKKAFH